MNDRIKAMKALVQIGEARAVELGVPVESSGTLTTVKQMIAEAEAASVTPADTVKAGLQVAASAKTGIEAMFCLSTCHVSKKTADLLEEGLLPVVQYNHGKFGWQIAVPTDPGDWEKTVVVTSGGNCPTWGLACPTTCSA